MCLFAGWRFYYPKINLHAAAIAFIALVLQAIAVFVDLGGDDVPKKLLFQISYLLLIFFVAANWRRIGILIIGAGLVLNFAAIMANGGLMPVTADAYASIGESRKLEGLKEGDALPNQKEILKSRENTHLYFLSDRIVWEDSPLVRLFSIGDVVIAGGLIVTIADLALPRARRVSPNDAGDSDNAGPGGSAREGRS